MAFTIVQVEKAPQESYADVGGLEQQIMEIKEAVELPLTHPELYEDIGIKPPKVQTLASTCQFAMRSRILALQIVSEWQSAMMQHLCWTSVKLGTGRLGIHSGKPIQHHPGPCNIALVILSSSADALQQGRSRCNASVGVSFAGVIANPGSDCACRG